MNINLPAILGFTTRAKRPIASHGGFLSHGGTPSYHPTLDHFTIEACVFLGYPILENLHIFISIAFFS